MTFKLARAKSQSIPRVKEKPLASGSSFNKGALLVVNGSDQFAECGADPASVAAVALSGAGASTEIGNHLGTSEFPPGFVQGQSVMEGTEFRCGYVGTLPAVAGGSYGVVRGADGLWRVDFAEVTALVVKYLRSLAGSPENLPEIIVTFLPAVVQII
jgi:hypothetical protein